MQILIKNFLGEYSDLPRTLHLHRMSCFYYNIFTILEKSTYSFPHVLFTETNSIEQVARLELALFQLGRLVHHPLCVTCVMSGSLVLTCHLNYRFLNITILLRWCFPKRVRLIVVRVGFAPTTLSVSVTCSTEWANGLFFVDLDGNAPPPIDSNSIVLLLN